MAGIRRHGDGWQVYWRDPDGTRRARTAPTKRAADELAREVDEARALGRRWQPRDLRPPPDLRAIYRAFLTHKASRLESARTLVWYGQTLDQFCRWLDKSHRKLEPKTLLTRTLLEQYHAELLNNGPIVVRKRMVDGDERVVEFRRRTTRSTARKHILLLEQAWEWAATSDEFARDVPPARRLELPHEPPPVRRAPTWAEMDAAISVSDGWLRKVAIVLRFTGLRVSQVMAIQRSDVDVKAAMLHVRTGKSRQERAGRFVPLSPHLMAEIEIWPDVDGGWLVPYESASPGRVVRARDMARSWRRAGIREVVWDSPLHCFRAGFLSELTRAGVARELREYLVGHAQPGVDAHYIDPEAMPLREAVNKIPPLRCVVIALEGRGGGTSGP